MVAIRRLNLKIERFGRWLLVDGLPRLASRFVDRRANARVYKYIAGACTAHTHSLGYATAVHSRGVSAALSLAPARFRFEEIRRTTLKKAVFTVLRRLSTSLLPLLFNRLFPSLPNPSLPFSFLLPSLFDIPLPFEQRLIYLFLSDNSRPNTRAPRRFMDRFVFITALFNFLVGFTEASRK